jgi:putative hydrolase of the HAD superfamily
MLSSLAAMGIVMGLITNGAIRSQRPKIEALKIGSYFGAVLISEEQEIRKPNPEIYLRATRQLKCRPDQTVFVGDHPDADIDGAAVLGMKTIWKRNECWSVSKPPDAIIDGLDEIVPVISTWRNPGSDSCSLQP